MAEGKAGKIKPSDHAVGSRDINLSFIDISTTEYYKSTCCRKYKGLQSKKWSIKINQKPLQNKVQIPSVVSHSEITDRVPNGRFKRHKIDFVPIEHNRRLGLNHVTITEVKEI